MQCVLWITKFESVTRAQRGVRTEWNVDPPTSKSIHQWERTLKETGTLVSQIGVQISSLGKPLKTSHSVRTRRCTRVTDSNSVNQSTPCTFYCGVHIFINEISVKSPSSAIAE
ncbi:uncharacterized protein TNCV_4021711 [Trichonephila clavipes]|nr:uncharacterized protein TNCV_4021711 [Trichonephila clavipes]